MPLLFTILASLSFGKPQRDYLEALFALLVGLPVRPTYRNLARFGGRCPHTHGRQAARACDFAALNLAGLCAVVPYAHDLAWAGDSTCLPKSGRQLPGVGWRWHGGEGRVAWGQQLELLSVLDLEEHCSYPVHARLQPAKGSRTCRRTRRGPRWRSCWSCWTRPWPWTTAPTWESSWGTATTAVRPWSRGCGRGVAPRQQAARQRRPVGALHRLAAQGALPSA